MLPGLIRPHRNATQTVFSQSLGGGTQVDNWNGWTMRSWFNKNGILVPPNPPTRARFGFYQGGSEGYSVVNAFVGHQGVESPDYVNGVRITKGGASAWLAAGGGVITFSDWVLFAWDRASNFVVAHETSGDAGNDTLTYFDTVPNTFSYFKNALEASTGDVVAAGYTAFDRLYGIVAIEMDGF